MANGGLDPALSFRRGPNFDRNLVGCSLSCAFNGFRTRGLPVGFRRARNDEAKRIRGCNGDDQRHGPTRHFTASGLDVAGTERLQTLGRHKEAFDHRLQLGAAGTETDRHSLRGAALVDKREIAGDQTVAHPRRRLAGRSNRGKSHPLQLDHEILCDLEPRRVWMPP